MCATKNLHVRPHWKITSKRTWITRRTCARHAIVRFDNCTRWIATSKAIWASSRIRAINARNDLHDWPRWRSMSVATLANGHSNAICVRKRLCRIWSVVDIWMYIRISDDWCALTRIVDDFFEKCPIWKDICDCMPHLKHINAVRWKMLDNTCWNMLIDAMFACWLLPRRRNYDCICQCMMMYKNHARMAVIGAQHSFDSANWRDNAAQWMGLRRFLTWRHKAQIWWMWKPAPLDDRANIPRRSANQPDMGVIRRYQHQKQHHHRSNWQLAIGNHGEKISISQKKTISYEICSFITRLWVIFSK